MAGQISSFASGLQGADGSRATSVISTNTRVKTTRGYVGLVTDSVLFPTTTGLWFFPNQRVRISNTPTISKSSVGVYPDAITPGAMMVVEGDSNSDAM
jgi:hypothetical protein